MIKRAIFLLGAIVLLFNNNVFSQWTPDILGDRFQQMEIYMPEDYEGKVKCVLIRRLPENPTDKAVLYIHGFSDYFFHTEQASRYNEEGYAFYAVDLRKYGRSYMDHQKMGNLKNIEEYYEDIDSCLAIILNNGYSTIILAAHSTGGLIGSLYAHDKRDHFPVNGMVLNSPFLDMNFNPFKEKIGVPVVATIGAVFPNIGLESGDNSFYGESLHQNYQGEWDYNLEWKPCKSIPVSFGWTRAIHRGHKKLQKGLDILCPVLVMHSDKSVYGDEWSEDFTRGDAVLDVEDIHSYAPYLGKNVTVEVINDGLHDLVLSKKEVRDNVYQTIFSWLKMNNL